MQSTTQEKQQGLYEGMFILNAALSEDGRQKVWERVLNMITSRGGSVEKIHDQGRRRLAYEINGRREGYYYLVYFKLPTQAMKDLWRDLRLDEEVIRFMTLTAERVLEKLEFKSLVTE
ncbi:MAG: 30S ribosomal protein S6 [Chlamydiia bacterium]